MNGVQVRIPVAEILRKRGLGTSKRAQRMLAEAVRQRCDKYVPFDTGALKNTAKVAPDGRRITYVMPYAADQFYTSYRHRAPRRGDRWHRRMLLQEKEQLLRQVSGFLKGGTS